MANFNWPSITAQTAPVQYELDGIPTSVSQDTVTPANSTPLPVQTFNSSGAPVDPATEATLLTRASEATLGTRASEATLATRATEATLGTRASESTLSSLNSKDFATQATLATRASEATLATRASEATLGTRASEATLSTVSANIATLAGTVQNNEVNTRLTAILSTIIATTTPLGSGATYTSGSEELLDYENVGFSIETDRNGTAFFEYSQDNVTWYATFAYPITVAVPGTPEAFYYQVVSKERYFRLRYVNGGTAQGVFRVQAILRQIGGVGEVQAVGQPVVGQESALVTKGVIYGLSSGGGGTYVAVKVNPSGSLETNVSGTVAVSSLPAPAVPTALTVKQAAVTVGTTAVRLTTDGSAPSATRRKLQFIIEPGGADNFFVGSSSVTSSGATRGIRVYPGTLYTYDNDAGDYFIVSDSAAQTVFVTEQE